MVVGLVVCFEQMASWETSFENLRISIARRTILTEKYTFTLPSGYRFGTSDFYAGADEIRNAMNPTSFPAAAKFGEAKPPRIIPVWCNR